MRVPRPGTRRVCIVTIEPSAPAITRTLAFLLTDVEGSTRLWEQHPEAMRGSLAQHDRILIDAVESARGRVIKKTGDGLMAVFDAAPRWCRRLCRRADGTRGSDMG